MKKKEESSPITLSISNTIYGQNGKPGYNFNKDQSSKTFKYMNTAEHVDINIANILKMVLQLNMQNALQ